MIPQPRSHLDRDSRLSNHLQTHHYVALLLDPRATCSDFGRVLSCEKLEVRIHLNIRRQCIIWSLRQKTKNEKYEEFALKKKANISNTYET
jgi:hypothetical protein